MNSQNVHLSYTLHTILILNELDEKRLAKIKIDGGKQWLFRQIILLEQLRKWQIQSLLCLTTKNFCQKNQQKRLIKERMNKWKLHIVFIEEPLSFEHRLYCMLSIQKELMLYKPYLLSWVYGGYIWKLS